METNVDERHPYASLTEVEPSEEFVIDFESVPADEIWLADHYPLAKREYYQKLHAVDSGRKNGVWRNSQYQTYLDNDNLIEIVQANLGLTLSQREGARATFHRFDLRKWGVRKERVAVALCLYLIHDDDNDQRECHPNTSAENWTKECKAAREEYGLSWRQYTRLYHRVGSYFNGQLASKTRPLGGVDKGSAILSIEGEPEDSTVRGRRVGRDFPVELAG